MAGAAPCHICEGMHQSDLLSCKSCPPEMMKRAGPVSNSACSMCDPHDLSRRTAADAGPEPWGGHSLAILIKEGQAGVERS